MDSIKGNNLSKRRTTYRILLFLYDVFAVNFAYMIALVIRFSDADSYHQQGARYMQMFREFSPWYTVICMVLFILFRLYSGVWRYAGFNDLRKIIIVSCITCALYVIGSLLVVGRMPISVYILGAVIQFIMMGAVRIAPRYIIENYKKNSGDNDMIIPMMIVGVGENTRIIQNKISRDGANIVRPVCVADYGYKYKGNTFNGLPVFCGIEALEECIKKYDIRCVVIADGNIPDEFINSLRKLCRKKSIEIRDFLIGTEHRTSGIRMRDFLETVECPVRIIGSSVEERLYSDGKMALKSYSNDNTVDSVSISGGELNIRVHHSEPFNTVTNDDWIRKYREETGDDVSFF